MKIYVEVKNEEFPMPPSGKESDEEELDKCAKKLRQIVSEKVGLNCDEYEVTLVNYNVDQKGIINTNLNGNLKLENPMEGKMTFWLISDDASVHYLDRSLRRPKFDKKIQDHVLSHLEYKIVGQSIYECMNLTGSPDIFIVDMSSVSNYNANDRHFDLLKKFAQQHSSALFCIVSMFKSHMENGFNELCSYVKDEIVVEMWGNGNESLADYMYKKVLQYYPYKGK